MDGAPVTRTPAFFDPTHSRSSCIWMGHTGFFDATHPRSSCVWVGHPVYA